MKTKKDKRTTRKPIEIEKVKKKKKYRIDIKGQYFDFNELESAKERVKELLDCKLWWIELKTVEVENE